MNNNIDARNVSTDTLLVVSWSKDTTPSMWRWEVIVRGTVGYGGTLPDTNYQGETWRLDFAKDDALIMHPGPMNRGIEIDTNLADDINKSVIKEQVELGVAVRMACLKIFCE